jgi:hypothetical protein
MLIIKWWIISNLDLKHSNWLKKNTTFISSFIKNITSRGYWSKIKLRVANSRTLSFNIIKLRRKKIIFSYKIIETWAEDLEPAQKTFLMGLWGRGSEI